MSELTNFILFLNRLFSLSMILVTSLVNSAEIVCQWNGDDCTISSITPVTQRNEDITIAGKPANYISTGTQDIKLFKLGANLNYVPTKIFSIFPYAYSFSMSSVSSKTTLETNSIVNCNSLNNFGFYDMNIYNVPEGFAQTCTNVKFIFIQNAGIDTIHKNAFLGLTKVHSLYMNKNRITCLPTDLFQTMPNVEYLDLQSNRISAIDSGLFRNLQNLHAIELRLNLISYLPILDFSGSAQYRHFALFLSGNPIYAMHPNFCSTLNSRPVFAYEDMLDVPQIKCLPGDVTTVTIKKSNCQGSMAIPLQKCYSNWTSSMNAPVKCGIPWCSIWQQILDSLKKNL